MLKEFKLAQQMALKKIFNNEIEAFIKDFIHDLAENNVAIFAGAGMSKAAGYVDWCELLCDIATELGLSVDKEHDLISLAQFHENENNSRAGIIKKILREFSCQAEPTENHNILAQLPISTYWTTNYDTLLEDTLKAAYKIVDVKHHNDQLANTRPKRDVVVYKMHGDVQSPDEAILTKSQYERYYRTHEPFITALSGDLVSKTFLFIGFSFNDPNLDYVFSRLNLHFGKIPKRHYCFIKREAKESGDTDDSLKYKQRRQDLRISDLKRYGIKGLLIDDYSEITEILRELASRFRKRTIFISGSAEEFGSWEREDALKFIHVLSKKLIQNDYRIVTGFGLNVGSAIINGAIETIHENPSRYSEDQLVMRPFPQIETGEKKLPELWKEYRHMMIPLAGISVFLFGNKKDTNGKIIIADGVLKEFEISNSYGLIPIPIASTEYAAKEIFNEVIADENKHFEGEEWIVNRLKTIESIDKKWDSIIDELISLLNQLNN